MNPGASQTRLLTMAATEWAKQDSSATLQWVSQINDPALRQQLIGSAVVGYAELDPVAAATCLLQSAPTEAELSQSLAGITWAWAMKDPAAAAIWVADFPAGTTQQTALENLLNIWGNHDPAAATSWIEHLPDPALQTKAAKILLTALPAAAAP
jgi:hypothetical protein